MKRIVEFAYKLASDEDVQKWQSAIANYIVHIEDEISLVKLQCALEMLMVKVWLGLLLGGFTLEQCGDFYYNQNVWVKSSEQLSEIGTVYPPIPKTIAFADASERRVPLALFDKNHPAVGVLKKIANSI